MYIKPLFATFALTSDRTCDICKISINCISLSMHARMQVPEMDSPVLVVLILKSPDGRDK